MGLTADPEGDWFCPDCKAASERNGAVRADAGAAGEPAGCTTRSKARTAAQCMSSTASSASSSLAGPSAQCAGDARVRK